MNQTRCINLDWFEVFAIEPNGGGDMPFFVSNGFFVDNRGYGTRIYHEMFTLIGSDGNPLLEIRRRPKNPLMPSGSCHIRLVNATCYRENAADIMRQFLNQYGYTFCNVSRADICLDFVLFDDNTRPRVFMQRYMRGKFSKVNQANIHAHGSDRWTGRVWNSVSWGSPSSPISTKFYNKTLELYDPSTDSYGKPHIRFAWLNAGLIDDFERCTLNNQAQEIWRVEFSIKSAVKNWVTIELDGNAKKYYSIRNNIDMYDSKEKLLTMFASLSQHYFHFKRYQMGVRKDRCPDRKLFQWNGNQPIYVVEHPDMVSSRTPDPLLLQLIHKLRVYIDVSATITTREPSIKLLQLLQRYAVTQEMSHPASFEERRALQLLLDARLHGEQSITYNALLDEIRKLMNIGDKVAIF